MSTNGITSTHVKKLGHPIEEIRSRALDNVISKLDLGFHCNTTQAKAELVLKLFDWFAFDSVPQVEKVLGLLLRLAKTDDGGYVNAFNRLKFLNELHELRRKLDSAWYDRLGQIEQAVLSGEPKILNGFHESKQDHDDCDNTRFVSNQPSAMDSMLALDLSLASLRNLSPVSKATEGGVKWLAMPWQPLVTSDRGVLTAVEEALSSSSDTNLVLHTCQFITNVMMQDFPAEVFLQRPTIVQILHSFLESDLDGHVRRTILRTLQKLTRSLRLRIAFYCDPCIANRKQKLLARRLNSNGCSSRDSPDGGLPEPNYQAYQSTGTSERSQSLSDNQNDSILKLQQMHLPTYCIETLRLSISQLESLSSNPRCPLRTTKLATDLGQDLVRLLISSVMPNLWLCQDRLSLKVNQDLKSLMDELGLVLERFRLKDGSRSTYLSLLILVIELTGNLVPLEIAEEVLPRSLKDAVLNALMDAPVYLCYPRLHAVLHEYSRQFRDPERAAYLKAFEDLRTICRSVQASISLLKDSDLDTDKSKEDPKFEDRLKTVYASRLSLSVHGNMAVVRKAIRLLQNLYRYNVDEAERNLATKLILHLLASGDAEVQTTTYSECHSLVRNVLGADSSRDRLSWESLGFLIDASTLTEILSHGVTHDHQQIREMSEDILVFFLKGKTQMPDSGWLRTLDAIVPILGLLQCHGEPSTSLGRSVTKMFDPDVYSGIRLPYIEVIKGNLRFLFASNSEVRDEAIFRLIWLLGKEKDSNQKLPKLSSLHGLPLASICLFERQISFRRSEGNYQKSNLLPVLEMLREPNVDPKTKKSALVQISVMLTDLSLHRSFIDENGLQLLLDILDSALIERDYTNYPDSVVPIIGSLKLLASNQSSVRQELSIRPNVFLNLARSLFLYPNNECVRIDGSQLLCLLLYHEFIRRTNERNEGNTGDANFSLPHLIVARMRLPFGCRSHGRISPHRRSEATVLRTGDESARSFLRQFWAWEWWNGPEVLWRTIEELQDPVATGTDRLILTDDELERIRSSSLDYSCEQQLFNVQNSITHDGLSCALDHLTMYLRMYRLVEEVNPKRISGLPWERTFERFFQSQPTSKQDCDLLVDVLNFLQLYVHVIQDGTSVWVARTLRNVTKTFAELFRNAETESQAVQQSILRLARSCCVTEARLINSERHRKQPGWIRFIELVVSTLCLSNQQHFYNLAYLDWLLTCLTYLISQCDWLEHKSLLVSLGNTLIELIISFHGAGAISFMGLSITRNSIVCLNHLLYQMQLSFSKNAFAGFWYDEEARGLGWLPTLWQNRDPLIRASGLQLLAGLLANQHTAVQLLTTMALAPSEFCQTILQHVTARDEACIVREQACIAFGSLLNNCNSLAFQYVDSLKPNALLIYVEQSGVYQEIAALCSNLFLSSTLDCEQTSPERSSQDQDQDQEEDHDQDQDRDSGKASIDSSLVASSLLPRTISCLYNCQDELQQFSGRASEIADTDSGQQLITTPSLVTAACRLLNNLVLVGQQEAVRLIYEQSLDKSLFGCLGEIPRCPGTKRSFTRYRDILEMYTAICAALTNCVAHSGEYASLFNFSADSLYTVLSYLNADLYGTQQADPVDLRDRLWTEVFNLLSVLSLTDDQHSDALRTALDLCGPDRVLRTIYTSIRAVSSSLRMSCVGCLAFLLSLEVQKESNVLREVLDDRSNLGQDLFASLQSLLVAYSYQERPRRNRKSMDDKDLVLAALTNLLCLSRSSKAAALRANLPETVLGILREIYVRLNLQPFELYKSQMERDRKTHPLLHDVNGFLVLLMNFMYNSVEAKESLTRAGLADVLHKLWAWLSPSRLVLSTALKLLATYTTRCHPAAQSLTLTTVLPGSGVRRTPNTLALLHVLVQLIGREIDAAGQSFDNQRLHFGFLVLRNAVHVHECRVAISKSNLLQFFTKIHPVTTRRAKPWPLVELYCLEFLIDFSYYEEGQLCVPKAVDGLDVLLQLAKCTTTSTRILALSILRNLAFNLSNRARLLSSVEFMNLLHDTLKHGSVGDLKIGGSILWSLVSNNQKGKLIARSAGFGQSLQAAVHRLSLSDLDEPGDAQDLIKMLNYVARILNPG